MNRSMRALLAAVLVCIIGSAAFIIYKVFFSNPSRSIPLLKGGSVIEAVQTLERMGIKARIEEEDSALPRGTVIGQWPETGIKLRADKTAILKVSRGTEKVSLPDVRGLPLKQAVDKIQDMGFTIGEIQKINHERPAGVVIAQNPASPASVSPTREIGLLVSLGPAVASGSVVVPDLIERDERTAMQLARESALRPSVEYVYDTSSPKGMVISMNPGAGTRVPRNSGVALRVSSWDRSLAPEPRENGETDDAGENTGGEKSAGGAVMTVIEPQPDEQTEPAQEGGAEPGALAENSPGTGESVAPGAPETQPADEPEQKKIANIRYQAPPVKNQTIVIEMIDKTGEHRLLNRQVKPGENIRLSVPYVGEAIVTIYLGGNFVWQDRYM